MYFKFIAATDIQTDTYQALLAMHQTTKNILIEGITASVGSAILWQVTASTAQHRTIFEYTTPSAAGL